MNAAVLPSEIQQRPTAIALFDRAAVAANRANAIQVTNEQEYATAIDVLRLIAAERKALQAERLEITRPMDDAKRKVMESFDRQEAPLITGDRILRDKVKARDAELKQIADNERQKAEAAAAEERRKIQAKADEEKRKADEKARQEREEAQRQQQEKERLQKISDDAKSAGDMETARLAQQQANEAAASAAKSETKAAAIDARAEQKVEALQNRATSIVAPLITAPVQKVAGKSNRVVWKWRLTDDGKSVGAAFKIVDDSKITKAVNAMKKDAEGVIGGIEVWSVDDLSIKAAK